MRRSIVVLAVCTAMLGLGTTVGAHALPRHTAAPAAAKTVLYLTFDWGSGPGTTTWTLNNSTHTFKAGDSGHGTWSRTGKHFTLVYHGGCHATYVGIIKKGNYAGTMTCGSQSGTWSATPNPPSARPTHLSGSRSGRS